jgi:hypothetical protein
MEFPYFFLLLFILFVVTGKLTNSLYRIFYLITLSKNVSIWLLSLLILPGTIIHEISHFLSATILRVPAYDLSIIPRIEKDGNIKAGELIIGDTDPIRRTIIGLAPMLSGLLLIYFTGNILSTNLPNILNTKYYILIFFGIYSFFAVSSTMYSSKKDLEILKIVGPAIILLVLTLYFIGVRISFTNFLTGKIVTVVSSLNQYLLICIIIDLLVLLITFLGINFFQKILGRKIVQSK